MSAETRHAKHRNPDLSMGACPDCQRDRRSCRAKTRYTSQDAVNAGALRRNIAKQWQWPVVGYRCCWCLMWHLTTARTKVQMKRAEKARREWLIRQAEKDLRATRERKAAEFKAGERSAS